jgi:predicted transcriptional regulator
MLARATDPTTSKDAARAISQYLVGERFRAWELLRLNPNSTANELAQLAGDRDNRRIGRRLPELENLGLVVRAGDKVCSVTGRDCTAWYAYKQMVMPPSKQSPKDKLRAMINQKFDAAIKDAANTTPTIMEEYRLKAVLGKLRSAVLSDL